MRVRRSPHPTQVDSHHGWTLIEMLVAVAVVGILAAVLALALIGLTHLVSQRTAETELRHAQGATKALVAGCPIKAGTPCGRRDVEVRLGCGCSSGPATLDAPSEWSRSSTACCPGTAAHELDQPPIPATAAEP
jgi:prepilin-type N-terminal cleavage/methylation domain-containing protein